MSQHRVIVWGLVVFLSTLALGAPARADVRVCLVDNRGTPLRKVWVQHFFRDYMTGTNGCVTIDADGPIDVRVFAHNPVIRMDDAGALNWPVSQEIKGVRDGDTAALPAQSAFWRLAERFRNAYDNGLREFSPWDGAAFPAAEWREPSHDDFRAGLGVLRATWPDDGPAVRAWTEGAAPYGGLGFLYVGFPLVHLKENEGADTSTIAHELGHALHFAKSNLRVNYEAIYGTYLATHAYTAHCFDLRTDETVAWIEAFGFFAEEYAATPAGAGKHERFFDRVGGHRRRLLDGLEECANSPQAGQAVKLGDDVEGAVFLALFHDFARHPAVGLNRVVETYVTCDAFDVHDYAECIGSRYGHDSEIYRALVSAAGCYGIAIDGHVETIAGEVEAGDRFGAAVAHGDWNADGFGDVAVGSPGEAVGSAAEAGFVNVLYGMPGGLSTKCSASFTQNSAGIPSSAEAGDRFGDTLATGDFDGDGVDDLAVAAPKEDVGATVDAGWVVVLPGSVHGLDLQAASEWTEDSVRQASSLACGTTPCVSGQSDHLGHEMAAGDFDGNGADDLAISVTGEDVGVLDSGAVLVVYGELEHGLRAEGAELLKQREVVEQGEYFGQALAAGDFDGDTIDDLAVGAYESVGTLAGAGSVSLLYGRPQRLFGAAFRTFTQGAGGIRGTGDAGDDFGHSLRFGDFDADGIGDLAIGAPKDEAGTTADAGTVTVLYGSASRTAPPRNEVWSLATAGVPGTPRTGDRFGAALAVGDFDGIGPDDLAIGVPNARVGADAGAGAVSVLYGWLEHEELRKPAKGTKGRSLLRVTVAPGLDDGASQLWTQDSPGIKGSAEPSDGFGTALAAGDFDGDGRDDLAVGVPAENIGSASDAGIVHEIVGGEAGLDDAGDEDWDQGS